MNKPLTIDEIINTFEDNSITPKNETDFRKECEWVVMKVAPRMAEILRNMREFRVDEGFIDVVRERHIDNLKEFQLSLEGLHPIERDIVTARAVTLFCYRAVIDEFIKRVEGVESDQI